jgi:Ca2+-binding RTX toxin-like protein
MLPRFLALALLVVLPSSSDSLLSIRHTGDQKSSSTTRVTVRSGEPPTSAFQCQGRLPTIVGTVGNDHLRGTTSARDVIWARAGDDLITGLTEEDSVCAGAGHDLMRRVASPAARVEGGAGDDRIVVARAGRILAGPGNDRVVAERVGRIVAGAGDDVLMIRREAGMLRLGPGADRVAPAPGLAAECRWAPFRA